ncbi:zeta toxin family protein [Arthrobacter ramosus]|uniref:zeta toxin family protein n=1 Tax=Arthrobacter ramosus TaxID=1672 RepID=UPI001F180551|nr:zeta toxin family protein [Arthrobacter ramosus]
MTTEEQAAVHRAHLERLGSDGGPLTAHSPHATTQNPEWFNVRRGAPLEVRRQLHTEILARFTAARPEVRRDRKAIVLAGPPGAGKSTAQHALIKHTRSQPEHWLAINADDFKDELLEQARQDGSYDSYLVPEEVRELEAAGEKFYPRELAALVHNESSILSKKATNEALKRGDNVIIDGTLGNEKQATMLMDKLAAAGYDVMVADVETTRAVSEARTMGRWERGYLDAENGTAKDPLDAKLGGRWVPQSFPASLFTTPEDEESRCAANSAAIANDYGCVSEYVVYRVEDRNSGPVLESTKGRTRTDGPLVDGESLTAVRTAAGTRAAPSKGRHSSGKDFGR